MATGPKYSVKFRRARDGKTNYKTRLALLKSRTPRMVVRIFNKNITCQIIEHKKDGDVILASVCSKDIAKLGWTSGGSNIPAGYLIGYLCAKIAKKAKIKECILDMGRYNAVKGTKPFAVLAGAIEGGLTIPYDENILPIQERLIGTHINEKIPTQVSEVKKAIDSKF